MGIEVGREAEAAVEAAGAAANAASDRLAAATDAQLDAVLAELARLLKESSAEVLAANRDDHEAAAASGLGGAMLDRLRIDEGRLHGMVEQVEVLAATPRPARLRRERDLPGGMVVLEKRRPVGVVGVNFEARPNVAWDMASQCLVSRNAAVLRTGSAALRTAAALVDLVVGPALEAGGLPAGAVQLLRLPSRETAVALVRRPDLLPLVILRGSGDMTRDLSAEAARHGVRVLAHADGGGVLYVDSSADRDTVLGLVEAGTDRLGVCNRLNLLLLDRPVYDAYLPLVRDRLAAHTPAITLSEPPHEHELGREWALLDDEAATVTVAPVDGPADAARTANRETSGLAATVAAEDDAAAAAFVEAYAGTGVLVNETTRLLDGYKLLGVPETGINVDRLPGPRGPVTFRDLYVRQYVVAPASRLAGLGLAPDVRTLTQEQSR